VGATHVGHRKDRCRGRCQKAPARKFALEHDALLPWGPARASPHSAAALDCR
jgi:hypothetical protein